MSDPSHLRVADDERRQPVNEPARDEDAVEARLAAGRRRQVAREGRHSSRRDLLR